MIYLQTPTDVLRRRLRERARANPEAERLDDTYIRELNEAYNHFFFHYTATPLLVVETSQFDLSWGDEALADLERQIEDDEQGNEVLRAANVKQSAVGSQRSTVAVGSPSRQLARVRFLNFQVRTRACR